MAINDNDMKFIFQYNLINLEYLNLNKQNITNDGIKYLDNESLRNIKYLNLSNNYISDIGLTYLRHLKSLKELELVNVKNLSEDYFLSLQENNFVSKLNNFYCDKKKLTLKYISSNFNNFVLPNLNCVKLIDESKYIHIQLKILFKLNNICQSIKELDLSYSGISDNGMLRLSKNISLFKNLERLNLENKKLQHIVKNTLNKYKNKVLI